MPFIFCEYWRYYENRVAMSAVFEDLAWLEKTWTARDADTEATCDQSTVDVKAKVARLAAEDPLHTFIVAANQSYDPVTATVTVPALAAQRQSHLLVLRENRMIPVNDGRFTDTFDGLGAHIYTTVEALPSFATIAELEMEINRGREQVKAAGNLLASGKIRWCINDWGRTQDFDSSLIDGRTDAGAWYPIYNPQEDFIVIFEQPLTFSRVAVASTTIRDAELAVADGNDWRTIHKWHDQYSIWLEWRGDPVTTTCLRIRPTASRRGIATWLVHEISELGIYQ